ncbi:hypothetical protein HUW62_22835 [Myxococcus sp. AM011]|uniref:hypothetical protein n=1 Tax=Myxococcus sp. AM011 TaxID=2745200 RepID=UPI0015952FB9|nr:hypothetical protein [Myxococcus sp. AM011]NVJ24067.1 hypothetical protein [Myxococcus sp. AM011]
MSEGIRTRAESSEGPTPEDVRVQLEGRAEVLEAALRRDALLESVLSGPGWKRRWREQPMLVPEWLEQESTVEEALERTSRRARVEGWADTLPVMKGLRKLEARRERLRTLVRKRLSRLVSVAGAPVLKVELARLDGLVRKRTMLSLGPGEVLLFQSARSSPISLGQTVPRSLALLYSLVCVLLLPLLGKGWAMVALVALILSPVFWLWARSGRVWMTSKRLLWMPTLGEAVSVPLSTIAPGGVHLGKGPAFDLKVDGEPRFQMSGLADAEALATLLELHSQPPLRGLVRSGVRLGDVVVFFGSLEEEGKVARPGWAVLRPGGVSFLPDEAGRQVLSVVTGRESALEAEVGQVVEQLRWLSGEEFDAWLTKLVTSTGGVSWSAQDSLLKRDNTPLTQVFRVSRGSQVLKGEVEWSAQSNAEWILRTWPDAATREQKRARK